MISSTPKNVVRCTLQSYIGKNAKTLELGARQREAVERLCQLRDDKFEELCNDTINEIHRRSGLRYDTGNKMQDKFTRLNDQRFKSLVLDILTVFYLKNPSYKMEDFPEFLGNLKKLIDQLKIDAERTMFLKRLESEAFYHKIDEYMEKLKWERIMQQQERNSLQERNLPPQLSNHDLLEKNETVRFFEFLSFPKSLIDLINETETCRKIDCQKLANCRKRILDTFSNTKLDLKNKIAMAKHDLTEIVNLWLPSPTISSLQLASFNQEINEMIDILDSLTLEAMGSDKLDLNQLGARLLGITERVVHKSEDHPQKESLYTIRLRKISLESLADLSSKTDSLQLIIDMIKDIRKLLAEIKA